MTSCVAPDAPAGRKSDREIQAGLFRIGYALSAKKAHSFLRQELIDACRQRNVLFVPVDKSKELLESEQTYDAILHKDCSPEWARQLEDYSAVHPKCILIDPPEHIVPLHNRVSMLKCVDEALLASLKASLPAVTLKVPRQISVTQIPELQAALEEGSMKFPVVAKPLVADGSAESHHMCLVLNNRGLGALKPPVVAQEFINHGGVIFKVYVVGDRATCTARRSLQDCGEKELENAEGVVGFSQISNFQNPSHTSRTPTPASCTDAEAEPSCAPLPGDAFVKELSSLLRQKLQLSLFNFDLIQDVNTKDYYIIDINYFPGFAKMPSYLSILSDYFAGVAGSHVVK